jgi:hypothetical protein
MKINYCEDITVSRASADKIAVVNGVINEYMNGGFTLTLRQLYYQLVSRGLIPNEDREYKKLGKLLSKGRMTGLVDWDAIEDRLRRPSLPYYVSGVENALRDTVRQYRLDRMRNQTHPPIEVWVEKDALSGVLSRVTEHYHLPLVVNRGYSSVTAMHDASSRLRDGSCILYFGDHDPSGMDMLRDVKERLEGFGVYVNVIHIGITMDQVEEFKPPPNPAKISDSRYNDYITMHGFESWEVDALPPQVLNDLLVSNIESRIDMDAWRAMCSVEELDKIVIEEMIGNYEEEVQR